MARLIEIQDIHNLPQAIEVAVGDVLCLSATGGWVRDVTDETSKPAVLELVGAYVQSIVGPAGEIVSPAGPPTILLVVARQAGTGVVDLVTGDPWQSAQTSALRITVR
jgi:hypothetical protein